MLTQEEYSNSIWSVIKSYFERNNKSHLMTHQISSYNVFIEELLPKLLKQHNPITLSYEYDEENKFYKYEIQINVTDYWLDKAKINENNGSVKIMKPQNARRRNLTYSSELFINLEINCIERTFVNSEIRKGIHKKTLSNISIGKLPVMLGSILCNLKRDINKKDNKECHYDLGGYFIINGSEKVLISQERQAENTVCVYKLAKLQSKYVLIAEIKSLDLENFGLPKSIQIKIISKTNSV